MREIKFRAWDIRNSKMVADSLSLSETQQLVTVNADYFNTPFSFFDGCKWMQFTGLKDRNGTDIYEGDIIATQRGNMTVIFESGMFKAANGKTAMSLCTVQTKGKGDPQSQECEVVGNIYANPELNGIYEQTPGNSDPKSLPFRN